jgi:hypothetical protein
MELLEKVKVQVDRSTVNLPQDRKTLQEFGKIWKKVYEALKMSPDQIPKYKGIVKRIADSAKTGMIDSLAGRFTFMGKKFDVEVDKPKFSEYAPTPWKIGFVGNLGESIVNEAKKFKKGDKVMIVKGVDKGKKARVVGTYADFYGGKNKDDYKLYIYKDRQNVSWFRATQLEPLKEEIVNESLICELPTAEYSERGVEAIDFRVEKLPISQDQKKKLTKNFLSGKGIIGRLPKSKKLMLFKPDGMKLIKQEPKDKSMLLPQDWSKYALILKDHLGEIDMKKSELKEVIREVVREVLNEKWEADVDVKKTGEHADKTIAQIKKEMEALKGKKPFNREQYSELMFALRAKQGWKKKTGTAEEGVQEAEKKPSAGLTKKKKSAVVKKAKAGKDIGKPGKKFKDIVAKAKKDPKVRDPEAVAAAAMWKNIKRG